MKNRQEDSAWLTIINLIFIVIIFIFFLFINNSVLAHKVSVFSYIDNNQLKGEGYFINGDKAQNCRVDIYDAEGRQVGSTNTNEAGFFSLPLPHGLSPFKIILLAGEGHQGVYTQPLTTNDFKRTKNDKATLASTSVNIKKSTPVIANSDYIELEYMINQALELKLTPLTTQIAKLAAERGIILQDIISGLGYILGLLGIVAYIKANQRTKIQK